MVQSDIKLKEKNKEKLDYTDRWEQDDKQEQEQT